MGAAVNFVERLLGWGPDGGDGSFEVVLLLVGVIVIFLFVLRHRLRGTTRDR